MHNLHLVVVKAENAKDACDTVETELSDWGNENNWRTICGCVSEDNEVYIQGDGRYPPEKDDTIETINKMVTEWVNDTNHYGKQAEEKLKTEPDITKWKPGELWSLQKYAEKLYNDYSIKGREFNILEDSYYEYEYDECGVTQITSDSEDKIYVVFVDMHS